MNQPVPRPAAWATILTVVFLLNAVTAGCGRSDSPKTTGQKSAKIPTVASLVPAATDLIVGMGAGDHLVAVSNYDLVTEVAGLPRVGDYQSIDWEKLAQIRPNVLISFYGSGHTPAGFLEKTGEFKISPINVRLDRLDEIYEGIVKLGEACNEREKAIAERDRLKAGIDAVRERYKGQPRVSALIAIGSTGADLAGPGTFFDDVLEAAGGQNVVTGSHPYVTLDREAVSALKPAVILQILPGKGAQTAEQARAAWASLSEVPAVRDNRVIIYTDDYIMQPGPHLAEVAERFAAALHPGAAPTSTRIIHHGDTEGAEKTRREKKLQLELTSDLTAQVAHRTERFSAFLRVLRVLRASVVSHELSGLSASTTRTGS
jgi:iron complex transport system substrate-binding protein